MSIGVVVALSGEGIRMVPQSTFTGTESTSKGQVVFWVDSGSPSAS